MYIHVHVATVKKKELHVNYMFYVLPIFLKYFKFSIFIIYMSHMLVCERVTSVKNVSKNGNYIYIFYVTGRGYILHVSDLGFVKYIKNINFKI